MQVKCEKCGHINYITRKYRSLNENRYFHGVLLPLICEYTGDEPEVMKIYLKRKFGWMKTETVQGEVVEVPVSTSGMEPADFEKFMTQIRMWGDTQGIYLPAPNEYRNVTT